MKKSLWAITRRLVIRDMVDFALSLPSSSFIAKDIDLSGSMANVLVICDLIEKTGRDKLGGAVWKTTRRYAEWKAYHTTKYITPDRVLDYIAGRTVLDPVIPASNFLVDAYDAVMGLPKYEI